VILYDLAHLHLPAPIVDILDQMGWHITKKKQDLKNISMLISLKTIFVSSQYEFLSTVIVVMTGFIVVYIADRIHQIKKIKIHLY
jgi:chromate transport protein ChrA